MTAEMFDSPLPRHRTDDHSTSVQGAKAVSIRAGSQKALLLDEYLAAHPDGLTSEEAADRAGLIKPSCCYWKRVSELSAGGWIRETGDTRKGLAGVDRMVYVAVPN